MASFKISKDRQDAVINYLIERKYPESNRMAIHKNITDYILEGYNASLPAGINKYDVYLNKSHTLEIWLPEDTFYYGNSPSCTKYMRLHVPDGCVVAGGRYKLSYQYHDLPEEVKELITAYYAYTKEEAIMREEVRQVVLGLTTSKKLLDAFPELEEVFLWLRSDIGNALVDVKSIIDVRAKLGLPA